MAKFTVYDFVVADRDMVARGKGYAFRSYTDRVGVFGNPGVEVIFNDGTKNAQGKPIGKAFSVNQSHYKLQAREGQKDVEEKLLVDFFKNAPFCLGSPNGDYTDPEGYYVKPEDVKDFNKNLIKVKSGELTQHNVKIKLLDDELDAKLALETGLKRAEAQISSGQIDNDTLAEIAALVGVFGVPEKAMRLKVYEFAGKRPIDYFKMLKSGDRSIRAAVRMGLDKGVLTQKGYSIYFDQTLIGTSEETAVSTLQGDATMLQSLKEALDFKSDKKTKKK